MYSIAQPRLNNTDTAENTRPQHTDEKRRLFSAARQERWLNKKAVAKILPNSRTARCCRYHLPGSRPAVLRDHSGHAFYAGLETCSSVWQCPICAAKISERRREELKNAFAVARGKGWFISMLTLTAPHYVHDELRKLMKSMCAAQNRLWKNNEHGLIRRFGILGRIRAFEITHGENGFHPHFHIILFSTKELGQEFEDTVFPLWCKYCLKCGLNEPSREHGVKLQNAREAHNYMSKWGIEEEMTKSHIKKNKNKNGSSMFDLLRRFRGGDKLAGRLFAVYAEAFKGQHQLKWTKGLKVLLGIDDASDEEINTETREDAELFHRFSIEEWNAVTATDSEYNILFCVEHHPERFDEVLKGIVKLWRIQYNEYRRLKRRQGVST